MRKILSVFMALALLLLPFGAFAQSENVSVKEKGFEIALTEAWQVADRNVKKDNPMLAIANMTKDEYLKYFDENHFYLEAIEKGRNTYLSLACEDVDPKVWGESFAEATVDQLTAYSNLLQNSMNDSQKDILKDVFYIESKNNKFLVFDHMNDENRMVFRTAITVYNSQSYTITMAGYYNYAEMMDEWDAIIESVNFSKPSKALSFFGLSTFAFIGFTLLLFVALVAILLLRRIKKEKRLMEQESQNIKALEAVKEAPEEIIPSGPQSGLIGEVYDEADGEKPWEEKFFEVKTQDEVEMAQAACDITSVDLTIPPEDKKEDE